MGNQQPCDAELGWLAGIIDGEGYLGMPIYNRKQNAHTVKVELQIVNTDPHLLDRVVDILMRIGISPYIRERGSQPKKHNRAWNVSLTRLVDIEKLLSLILPHLTGIKEARGQLMLEFVRRRLLRGRAHYDQSDLKLLDEFRALRGSTTIPKGSRAQERSKRGAQLKYIKL